MLNLSFNRKERTELEDSKKHILLVESISSSLPQGADAIDHQRQWHEYGEQTEAYPHEHSYEPHAQGVDSHVRQPGINLSPVGSAIRRYQHQMARQANLISHSYGKEPRRYVRIFREKRN